LKWPVKNASKMRCLFLPNPPIKKTWTDFPAIRANPNQTNTTNMTRQEILAKLRTILVEQLGCDADKITDEATLKDLGADSLDNLEVVIAVEEEFGIDVDDDEAEKITTVGQMVEHIEKAI
jgi:acyl carrier protein